MDSGPQSDIEDLRQRALKLVIGFGDAIKKYDLVANIKKVVSEDDDSDDDDDDVLDSMMDYVSRESRESLLKKVFGSEKIIASYIEACKAQAEISVINISEMKKEIERLEGILENVKTTGERPSNRGRIDMVLDTARMFTKKGKREVLNPIKRLIGIGGSKKSKSKNTKKSRGKRNMVKSLKKRQKHKTKSKKKN